MAGTENVVDSFFRECRLAVFRTTQQLVFIFGLDEDTRQDCFSFMDKITGFRIVVINDLPVTGSYRLLVSRKRLPPDKQADKTKEQGNSL